MRDTILLRSGNFRSCCFFIPVFILVTWFLPSFFLFAQEEKDIEWYHNEAQNAIMDEHYEYATQILNEAKKKFPENSQFLIQLGDLYYSKDFYELALNEYLSSDRIDPDDYYTLDRIQDCYGYLNQEYNAIEYLEKILDTFPPDEYISSIDSIDDLGWMYFKTHQLEKGEDLILSYLNEKLSKSNNRDLFMTLGTIYSGMYDYERSKEYYLKSIKEAEEDGDTYFASVAYYNLSLLEHTFYKFNSALQYTNDSLASQDRATGHLSKGELYQSQMNFPQALSEYEEGEKKDDTPLTKINITVLLRIFGRLDEALAFALAVYSSKDQSWMHNFGTDTKRHQKELYEIIADIYKGIAVRESTLPRATIVDTVVSFVSYLRYSIQSYYYRQKNKSYSLIVGKDYLGEQEFLDAYWEFYKANEDYRPIALKFLKKAEEIETSLIPHAQGYYLLEQGKILKDPRLLEKSMSIFDTFWEREGIAESLLHLIKILPRKNVQRREALNRLFEINPGAFLQNGLGLPLEIRFHLSRKKSLLKHVIIHGLESSGSDITLTNTSSNEEIGFRYVLQIFWDDEDDPLFKLSDRKNEKLLKEARILTKKGSIDEQGVKFVRDLLLYQLYYVERDM